MTSAFSISAWLRIPTAFLVMHMAFVSVGQSNTTFTDTNWTSMGGLPGANHIVAAAVVDGSGNLYIGGAFTIVGKTTASCIAKWDGTNWSALGAGMNNAVSALAV